jgi:hypothetical protein
LVIEEVRCHPEELLTLDQGLVFLSKVLQNGKIAKAPSDGREEKEITWVK